MRKGCRTCGLSRRSTSRQKQERRCRSRHSSTVEAADRKAANHEGGYREACAGEGTERKLGLARCPRLSPRALEILARRHRRRDGIRRDRQSSVRRAIAKAEERRIRESRDTMTKQVLFIQGGGEGTHEEWDNKILDSLKRELGPDYAIRYPRMPNEADPKYAAWKTTLKRQFAGLDDGAILVGHSIGGTI